MEAGSLDPQVDLLESNPRHLLCYPATVEPNRPPLCLRKSGPALASPSDRKLGWTNSPTSLLCLRSQNIAPSSWAT